jgi:transmembrane sensor
VVVGSEAAGSRLVAAQVHGAAPAPTAAAAIEGQRLALADGSIAVLGSASARLDVLHDEPAHIELALRVGSARFEVVPNDARSFVVTADPIRVVVVGTSFDVERDDAHIRIAVREGTVRVETPSELHHVGAGGSFWLDLGPAATSPQPAEPTIPEVALDPDALLEAADAARLNQQPKAAVVYLRRLLREHTTSSVAPLAGFTLGRVLLESLGQPSEAAAAFALARRKAPQGSLAQDALAREVEALSKAGRSREAYERAQSYVQQYPTGRRLRAVRLFGGLE